MRVEFEMRRKHAKKSTQPPSHENLPRLTRLLALAHRWNQLVDEGTVKDYAEIARLMGLSRARVTQITDLTLLASDIQEVILLEEPDVLERATRSITRVPDWPEQRELWRQLCGSDT